MNDTPYSILPSAPTHKECDKTAVFFSLCAYVVALAPHAFQGYAALAVLCVLLALWRVYLEISKKTVPSLDMTTVLGVAAIIVLIGFGQMRLTPSAGVVALMVLLGCKNLVAKTPAQFTNNLLLLPFLPMGLFLSNDPSWAAGYLLVFVVIWLTAMMRVWRTQWGVVTSLRHGALALMALAPLVAASYFFLPRPQINWNNEERQASTGMSSTLKPGDVGSLSQNHETAFLVKFDEGKIPLDYNAAYWRGVTLASYQNGEWSKAPGPDLQPPEKLPAGIGYTVVFPKKNDRYVYTLDYSLLPSMAQRYDGSAMLPRMENIEKFSSYRAVYYPKGWKADSPPTAAEKSAVVNDNPNATALAKKLWLAANNSPERFLMKWKEYVQGSGFVYTLQPGVMQTQWMDTFIQRRKGFCEHYAGTTAYMLRQVGVPSRVVVGFQGARPFHVDTLDVPYSAAHAWVEYWNNREWVRLDPTEWVAPDRLTAMHWERPDGYKPSMWWSNFGFLATTLDSQWKTWVTHYDADQQQELLRRMGKMQWELFAVYVCFIVFIAWIATGKRWHLLSPHAIHQRKWLEKALSLSTSASGVEIKRHLRSREKEWFTRIEERLYGTTRGTVRDYLTGIWFYARLKSRTYKIVETNCNKNQDPIDRGRRAS